MDDSAANAKRRRRTAKNAPLRKRNRELARLVNDEERQRLDERRRRDERLLDAFTDYRQALNDLRQAIANAVEAGEKRQDVIDLISLAETLEPGEQNIIMRPAKTSGSDTQTGGEDDGNDAQNGERNGSGDGAEDDAETTAEDDGNNAGDDAQSIGDDARSDTGDMPVQTVSTAWEYQAA